MEQDRDTATPTPTHTPLPLDGILCDQCFLEGKFWRRMRCFWLFPIATSPQRIEVVGVVVLERQRKRKIGAKFTCWVLRGKARFGYFKVVR